jgi:hypothetical protein
MVRFVELENEIDDLKDELNQLRELATKGLHRTAMRMRLLDFLDPHRFYAPRAKDHPDYWAYIEECEDYYGSLQERGDEYEQSET